MSDLALELRPPGMIQTVLALVVLALITGYIAFRVSLFLATLIALLAVAAAKLAWGLVRVLLSSTRR